MEYSIEKKDAFSVYGIEEIFTTDDDKHYQDIPMFWRKCFDDGSAEKLIQSTNGSQSKIHSLCEHRETGGNTFPYMLFAYNTDGCNTDGFMQVEVPAASWAIFKTEKYAIEQTSNVVQSLIKRVYTEWLPTAAYEKIDGYELEVYFDSSNDKSLGDGEHYTEIWVRVEPN